MTDRNDFGSGEINVTNINGFYGAYINSCEDCELFVTPTDPIRGTYCVRAQGFVFQHNPACEDFAKRKKEE